MEDPSALPMVSTATLAHLCELVFVVKVRTCLNCGLDLVELVPVLHQISSQVQVQFEVLSQRWEN
jgi:hypothetical protein